MIGVRRERRRPLLLLGVVPLLVALVVTVHVALMYVRVDSGTDALDRGDEDRARRSFAATNTSLNLLERWIAPYNEGVAAYQQGDQTAAMALFAAALDDAPPVEECRVRTNLGLATEARADQLRASRAGQARLLLHQARQAIAPCVDRDLLDELDELDTPRTDPDEDPVDDPIEDPVDDPVDAEVLAALPDEVRTALAAQDVRLVDKILDAAAEAVAVPDPQRPVTGREARFEDLTPPEQQEVLEQRNEVARERRRQQQESRDPQRRRPPPEDPRTYNW